MRVVPVEIEYYSGDYGCAVVTGEPFVVIPDIGRLLPVPLSVAPELGKAFPHLGSHLPVYSNVR